MRGVADALALAEAFVVAKNIDFVLPDRAAARPTELIAAESRFFQTVGVLKEVRSVERAVTEEFIHAAVELVGSRARDGVNDAARGIPIFRGVVAGEDRKFLNGVPAEILAEDAPGPGV